MIRRLCLIAPALLLAACQDEAPVRTGEGESREAAGEVLGGTISDDMLPLDRLRSQSPPLRVVEGDPGEAGGSPAEAASTAPAGEGAESPPAEDDTAPEDAAPDE